MSKFDPTVPTSIAFRPMGRAATEAFLNECEGGDPLGKKQAEHLDRLFVRVDEVASKHPPTATAIKMGYAEPIANLPSAPTVVDVGDDGVEMPAVNPLSGSSSSASAEEDDGSAVWVDFAKSPV